MMLLRLLAVLCLVHSASATACAYRSPNGYQLLWFVDKSNAQIYFNLTYYNFPQGKFTGVGFGDNMASGLDVLLVALPPGATTPQVIDGSVQGYTSPTRDANTDVGVRAVSYTGGTLNAQFTRPLQPSENNNRDLSGCLMWNFITSPGAANANGTFSKHATTPEQERECDIATRCTGTIPAVFLDTFSTTGAPMGGQTTQGGRFQNTQGGQFPTTQGGQFQTTQGGQFQNTQGGQFQNNQGTQFPTNPGPQFQTTQGFQSSTPFPPTQNRPNQAFGQGQQNQPMNRQYPTNPQPNQDYISNQYSTDQRQFDTSTTPRPAVGPYSGTPFNYQGTTTPAAYSSAFGQRTSSSNLNSNRGFGNVNTQPFNNQAQPNQNNFNGNAINYDFNLQNRSPGSFSQFQGPDPYQQSQFQQSYNPYPNQFNAQPFNPFQPQPNQIGQGAASQNPPFYNPYGNQQNVGMTGGSTNYQHFSAANANQDAYNNQQRNQQTLTTTPSPYNNYANFGRRKKRQSNNIYGYNYNSGASNTDSSLIQNPNYMFLPNKLADQYARTYSQAQAQYDQNTGRMMNNGPTTAAPVLSNSAQNQANFANIQRDSQAGRYTTIAPTANIYGYNYGSSNNAGSYSTTLRPSVQYDAVNSSPNSDNTARQRFYNPSGLGQYGNVFTGSLYNQPGMPSLTPASRQFDSSYSSAIGNNVYYGGTSSSNNVYYNAGTNRQFDATGGAPGNIQGAFLGSGNRGAQPGQQIVYYDTASLAASGRKKRSAGGDRKKRQFFDATNNQTTMYYPYRTSTNFNLANGQNGYSSTGGFQNGVNSGAQYDSSGSARFYDTSRGVYVSTPQFDSRGGNQYLVAAPVNPQSPEFQQTLQNNNQALRDFSDPTCSRQDPYWCTSYVQQIVQNQNTFNSFTNGLCNTLMSSLQYSDNRCCNAVRAAGCQI